ncbi:hypothetical protein DAPPUDRAFT_116372 [Daphnia pulex]|uniref:Uncharacterized protein n=1 Tax=Daphnia pulex TaxID=6669 RepID=E9HP67_DAPPU|nr:hypothetical protein DAPPUDRAFT_116372 [Daphnia pulex]|eukprot:EFX66457.1 hypothetical protein DAPPUDRAFT_116372 [Daphnia pulex]
MENSPLQLSTSFYGCSSTSACPQHTPLFICVYHKRGIAGFCVVFTDSCAVPDILNLSFPPSISARTAMSLAFSAALERVSEFRQSFSACDIFVSEMLAFVQPGSIHAKSTKARVATKSSILFKILPVIGLYVKFNICKGC